MARLAQSSAPAATDKWGRWRSTPRFSAGISPPRSGLIPWGGAAPGRRPMAKRHAAGAPAPPTGSWGASADAAVSASGWVEASASQAETVA